MQLDLEKSGNNKICQNVSNDKFSSNFSLLLIISSYISFPVPFKK